MAVHIRQALLNNPEDHNFTVSLKASEPFRDIDCDMDSGSLSEFRNKFLHRGT